MELINKDLCNSLIKVRRQHPAWLLLASPRAPLMISCLKPLLELNSEGILQEEAEEHLAVMLAEHANDTQFFIDHDDYALSARRELRDWIKRELIIERQGKIYATDALQQALGFIDGLRNRVMTSTASRLSIVQREIENLEMNLNPDPQSRTRHLQEKIKNFEKELEQVTQGDIEVLQGKKAIERIQEVYHLAVSLRADFRRVEDSYRDADRKLRQAIISEQHHRGEAVDALLDSHDQLLETPEGRVFHGFHEQLSRSVELDNMKRRLREILQKTEASQALNRHQQTELRRLVHQLVSESAGVIRARARSERDVKAFLKTGLAAEHHRVGQLLNAIFDVALDIDWSRSAVCKSFSTLPPVAIRMGNLPLIERLLFKVVNDDQKNPLELLEQFADLDEVEDGFWRTFDSLDRQEWIKKTIETLATAGEPMTLMELSRHLPPTHDLETLALWLSMALEAELPIEDVEETLQLIDRDGKHLQFHIPRVALIYEALQGINWEL